MGFCKKCNNKIDPNNSDRILSPDKWEEGGSRCRHCGYMYFLDYENTFFKYDWQKNYEEKKETLLSSSYGLLKASNKEIFRLFYFLHSLSFYITFYFDHEVFFDHSLLIDSLKKIHAAKTLVVAENVYSLYQQRDGINSHFKNGYEDLDDFWEEVSYSLYQSIDADIEEKIYCHYIKK